MANELTVTASIDYDKNNHQLNFTPEVQQITVAGEKHAAGVQALTTSHEAIVLNEVTAGIQGWAWFRNIGTDTSTHIKVGINNADSSFTEVFNLKGGEFAIMRLGGTALYAESSTGTLHLQYSIIEE
tara:strand:+ start:5363 stop:5743 length:381 start_codon:yes stop_codon:yes gene_type:complete